MACHAAYTRLWHLQGRVAHWKSLRGKTLGQRLTKGLMFPKGKNQKAIDVARLHKNTFMLDSVRLSSMLETYAPTTSEWAGIAQCSATTHLPKATCTYNTGATAGWLMPRRQRGSGRCHKGLRENRPPIVAIFNFISHNFHTSVDDIPVNPVNVRYITEKLIVWSTIRFATSYKLFCPWLSHIVLVKQCHKQPWNNLWFDVWNPLKKW